jgi:hypothetical protein
VSLQSKIQSPPVMSGRGAAAAAMKVKMPYIGEQRRRRAGGGRWRSSFSVPQSGGEVQETREQRKKTMVRGKKEKFTLAALFIHRQVRVVGVVVLHYPDRFCGKSPCGGMEWGGSSCNRATRQ